MPGVLSMQSSQRKWHWASGCLLAYSAFGAAQMTYRILTAWFKRKRERRMLQNVPQARYIEGPYGYVSDMLRNFLRMNDWRAEISAGLPVSKMFGPNETILLVRDPVITRYFLKDAFQKYTKALPHQNAAAYYLRKWMGDGIFTTLHGSGAADGGKSWMSQRKIASQVFSRSNFNNLMQEVFEDKAQRLRQVLAESCDQGHPVDMQLHFFNFTMDSILKIFFGEDSNTASGVPNKYGAAFDEAHHTIFEHIMKSTPFFAMSKTFLPWPFGGHDGLAIRIHDVLSPLFRRFKAANAILDEESRRLIRACRVDPSLQQRRDMLALFVRAEDQEHFSDSFLRDVVLNMIIAGRDTTACTLSWMFYALACNPEVHAKLCAEIDEKLPIGKKLTLKSLSASDMPYLNGVLYETLRLWPPVPSDSKLAAEDDTLPDGTKVTKGTTLVFLPYATGRDPERYTEPESMKPERWIPFKAPAPHEFPVFQAGPRICLGMDMAIFEAKLLAVELLRYFSFQLVAGQAQEITHGRKFTMAINNAKSTGGDKEELWMHLSRRLPQDDTEHTERYGGA